MLSFIKTFFQSFSTAYKLIRYGEQYVMKDLADEALSGKGYAIRTLFGIRNIVVLTGKDFVAKGVEYGEFARDQNNYDNKARSLFDTAMHFIGVDSLINWHGDVGILQERQAIKQHMKAVNSTHSITQVSFDHFKELTDNWPNDGSIEKIAHKVCANIIAETLLGFPRDTIDEECFRLIAEAEHEIFNNLFFVSRRLKKIQKKLKEYNDQYMEKYRDKILETESYSKYLAEHPSFRDRKLKDWNLISSLIAAGNLSSLLTGIIVKLAENPALQEELRQELLKAKLNEATDPAQFFKKLHNLKLLEGVYKEGLRFFTIAAPAVRYASKPAKINDVDIPGGSYIIIPLNRILTDERCTWTKGGDDIEHHWEDPENFNPKREFPSLSMYPMIPFSRGLRSCVAQFAMVEEVIKIGLALMITKNKIVFNPPEITVEDLPRHNLTTRLKQEYRCDLIPIDAQDQEKEIEHEVIKPMLLSQYSAQIASKNDEKGQDLDYHFTTPAKERRQLNI